jgi:hypothetical protein
MGFDQGRDILEVDSTVGNRLEDDKVFHRWQGELEIPCRDARTSFNNLAFKWQQSKRDIDVDLGLIVNQQQDPVLTCELLRFVDSKRKISGQSTFDQLCDTAVIIKVGQYVYVSGETGSA